MENEKLEVNKDLLWIMRQVRTSISDGSTYICPVFSAVEGNSRRKYQMKRDFPKFHNWIMYHGRKLVAKDILHKVERYDGVFSKYTWGDRWLSGSVRIDIVRSESNRKIRLELLDKFIKRLEKEERK